MKKLVKSKTIWLAVITFLVGGFVALESQMPSVGWVVMGKAIMDALLRFVTKDELIA